MNKQELISMYERISNFSENVNTKKVIANLQQLDKPQAGHAEKAPCYLRNVIARLRELPLHDREVWLQAIMAEFEEDFCHSIWREGYEQGKFEGAWVGEQLKDADKIRRELNKPVVPQFVADWYEKYKNSLEFNIFDYVYQFDKEEESDLKNWFNDINTYPFQTLVNMHQFGYEVEKEKRYTVKFKNIQEHHSFLNFSIKTEKWLFSIPEGDTLYRTHHTRKELEDGMFGWVFDCPGIEIEEVE